MFGALITFTTLAGANVASGYTDDAGRVTADSGLLPFGERQLKDGYLAVFAGSGDGIWLPATGRGTWGWN